MKLCITEKPSVARDIAKILGAEVRNDGYYSGGDYCVTWTFGHLCQLKEPHDYTEAWKRWSLGSLPMIPAKFGIKLIPEASYERQFHVIESLAAQADEIINCGDAGQEGELIQRWVMQKAGVKCPVRRLWISSLTDDAIREGFSKLEPQQKFDNLYYAGLSRAVGDWILGMNGTRLYSLKYSSPGSVLSIGRVQTPTLALIVQRHFEIENFKPEDYWELKSLYRDVTFSSTSGRFNSISEAEAVLEKLRGKDMCINDVQQKQGRESAPRLFDLTSLQVETNKKWGWTADQTLRLIQSLYEKKVTTYPRVDTTYLSEDIYPKIPDILAQMTPYSSLTATLLQGKISKSKKVFDNSKVTDHHAIIPTGQSPAVLVGDERKLYHLIALRFIAVFYPDCQFMTTTVTGSVDTQGFKATGKVITSAGWRAVYDSVKDEKEEANDSEDRLLPEFVVGESGPQEPSLQKKTTQPPKYYTEGTLLRAMESAGKTVDDEELRDAMKENGIGRPSTRAAIIETLFKRRYISRVRKSIMATQAGIDLINTIKEELLKSAKLTGIWENKLRRIERGDYSAPQFIDELKTLINDIVLNVLSDNSNNKIDTGVTESRGNRGNKGPVVAASGENPRPPKPRAPRVTKFEQVECPLCHSGHIIKGHTAFGCSRYREGCALRLGFSEYPDSLTPSKLKKALSKYNS
ncbi:DNA topoisomerase 3 [uncultured Duncaniella sp.]|uniref:DNA topoisomerase 3 n=1 Tax=uncultured Duncaniella sp. TaxID=2768039 RepID=UPI0025F1BB68|nr:DNA topoisomerase 3 [uncultured Duncaniella sp.]